MASRKTPKAKFAAYVMDQLEFVPKVSMRSMFGGYGIYCEGRFIALLWNNCVFMFTDHESRKKYKRAGMPSFEFKADQPESNYFMVPDTVLADKRKFAKYAQEAVAVRREFDVSKSSASHKKQKRRNDYPLEP